MIKDDKTIHEKYQVVIKRVLCGSSAPVDLTRPSATLSYSGEGNTFYTNRLSFTRNKKTPDTSPLSLMGEGPG
jgi:hypothetical protein